jgi:hypothetical protein
MELPDQTHARVCAICQEGDSFAARGNYLTALERYWAAWDLLPDPKSRWDAATWILGAVGDANFLSGDFAAGRDNLSAAMHCPRAIGNPFLHLRLGQCLRELGDLQRATDELTRAFMGGGAEIFDDADKDFAFLKERIRPPVDGW